MNKGEDDKISDCDYSCDAVLIVEVHWEELVVKPSCINRLLDCLQPKIS